MNTSLKYILSKLPPTTRALLKQGKIKTVLLLSNLTATEKIILLKAFDKENINE